ncbi:hypothetical protein NAEGRDRAFT_79307 [Naegleria gruberi]|uniref:Uncharacterized protein n=1 Tax=Naegleria gruberi TaxID=5762 RepID=D2VBF1_NAEGR|nr:uncharacterized protein NAEGRDRAFT_79307 [Naegleria gruberi]EFC45896.1 hypothetical protein NAEGRDRAFT_79307 [Naegleria gruberi]|eukprot:XP_002678640.1 hypothetical protein NAEGRDRAFT_79307 [Naegleria gruberi strain NEG-M]
MLGTHKNSKNSSTSVVGTLLSSEQKTLLQEASSETLIQYFCSRFTTEEDRISFAKLQGFKLDLFSNFLQRSEKYVTARFALLKLYAWEKLQWEIKSKDYARFLYDYHIAKNWEEIRKKIIDDAKQIHRKAIVFIDGDNLSNDLSLPELIEHYEKKKNLLHVVIVFANGVVNDAIMSYETKEFISIMHSITNTKDAADTCISLLLGSLHSSLRAFYPTVNHSFVVVTKDHFFEELSKQCLLIGRSCYPAKSIRDCVNILNRIDNNEVIEIVVEQKVTNAKISGVSVTKIVEKPTSEHLKELFNVAWLGLGKSQNQFCKTHNLDSTNFSKHMNGKKYNHACKIKLEEFYELYKKSTDKTSHFIINNFGNLKEIDINHNISGDTIEFEIDSEEFSFTTPHDYNPLYKESYPVLYEEWLSDNSDIDNGYRADFLKLVNYEKTIKVKLRGSILTLPLRMKDSSNSSYIPIDIELRKEENKNVELFLRAPIGQVNNTIHIYFTFSYWTPQEYIAISGHICCQIFGDLFGLEVNTSITTVTTIFKPTTIKKSNQVFYPENQIALNKINRVNDLIGLKCVFNKMGDEFVLNTRNSLKDTPSIRFLLKQSVMDYIKNRGNSEQVYGIIDSVESDGWDVYRVGCKVL